MGAAEDLFDPLDIFHDGSLTGDEIKTQRIKYGFGFGEPGQGATAQWDSADKTNQLYDQGQEGATGTLDAIDAAEAAGDRAVDLGGYGESILSNGLNNATGHQDAASAYGQGLAESGVARANDVAATSQDRANALAGFGTTAAAGLNDSAAGLRDVGFRSADAVMRAAQQQGPSQAQAQFDRGQLQARNDAMGMAATLGRGGNQALAGRQAMQALASQSATGNANMAIMRAQEEAALRNSRIGAATSAGQLWTGAHGAAGGLQGQAGNVGNQALAGAASASQAGLQGAGALSNQALSGAAGIESGIAGQNVDQANIGANLGLGALGAQNTAASTAGNLGNSLFTNANNIANDRSTAQLNANLGFGTDAQKHESEQDAAKGGAIQGILSMF